MEYRESVSPSICSYFIEHLYESILETIAIWIKHATEAET